MEYQLALFLFALTSSITPGPNNIMITASGVNFGIKRSLPHWVGICLGFPMMVLFVGLGFGVIFELIPSLHQFIKIAGVLYLLYLVWRIATAPVNKMEEGEAKPFSFIQAVLFQWVNPKAWVMATSAIAAYSTVGDNMNWQVLYIALNFLVVSFPSVGTWLVFGVGLKRYLQNALHQRIFNAVMAFLLLLSMSPVIVELVTEYF